MSVKPGYQTTELAVTLLVVVGQLIAALTSNLKPEWAAFGTSAASAAYALARGLAKRPTVTVAAPTTPVVVPPPTP